MRAAISKITGVADLEAERKSAPASAWLQRDQGDIDREILQQLDELSKTLGSSEAVRSWRELRERQRGLAVKRMEIDRLVQEAELFPSSRTELKGGKGGGGSRREGGEGKKGGGGGGRKRGEGRRRGRGGGGASEVDAARAEAESLMSESPLPSGQPGTMYADLAC